MLNPEPGVIQAGAERVALPAAWPFESISYATYARLSSQEKRQIEQVLAAYIKARGE
jgi:hypothetical protein